MDLQLKRSIKSRCHPDEAIKPGDDRHFDFDELGLRGRPWRRWLADEIRLADQPTAQVVTGLAGSGKTTELKQLQEDLEAEAYRVVYADIGSWLSDTQPITTTDLLLAIVLALYPDAKPDTATGWVRKYTDEVGKLLTATISIDGGGVHGIKANLTKDEALFQRVAARLRERDGLREEVFALLAHPIEQARSQGEELVLILDSGEKRATGELLEAPRRAEFHNAWFAAFGLQGRDLRPPLHVIYTVPPFMVRHSSRIAANFGGELQFLPMVRILEHTGELYLPGLRAIVEALTLRVPVEHFEDRAILYWLAAWSGGYFRDLLRFVNYMIHAIGDEPQFTRAHASWATKQVCQTYTQALSLPLEEKQVLQQLHPQKRFPEHEAARARMDSLLQGFKMFRYHNDSDWYDAHPLLWPALGFDAPITWEAAEALAAADEA